MNTGSLIQSLLSSPLRYPLIYLWKYLKDVLKGKKGGREEPAPRGQLGTEAAQAQRRREPYCQARLVVGEGSSPAQACHLPPAFLATPPASGVPSADKAFNALAFMLESVEGGARTRSKLPRGKSIVVLEFL